VISHAGQGNTNLNTRGNRTNTRDWGENIRVRGANIRAKQENTRGSRVKRAIRRILHISQKNRTCI